MFNKNRLLQPWFRFMARQLRKPTGFFAKIAGKKMNKTNRLMYKQVFENMIVEDADAILEIGFGNGRYFSELASRASNISLSGIELSNEMVKEGIKNNKALIENGTLNLHYATGHLLPFDKHVFDKIFCINVIYFWDNPHAYLLEIKRVLKNRGKLYIGYRPKSNMLQLPFTQYDFTMYSEDEWKAVLEKNGFTVVGISKTSGPDIKIGGKNIEMEAVCMIGEKSA